MRYRLLQVITTAMALLCGTGMEAQVYKAPPVTISKDKVRSNDGTLCYSHFVPEKQTLYSISKAYGVTIDEIYAVNPGLKEGGVKKNSIILIPVKEKLPEEKKETEAGLESAQEKEKDQAEEKVKKPEDIQEEEKVQEEEKIQEPEMEQKAAPSEQKDNYTVHRVKWYENIDDIALKYGIPAEYILEFNGLKDKKIRSRMKLKIPNEYHPGDHYLENEEIRTVQPVTEEAEKEQSKEESIERDWFNSKKNVNILLTLPFNTAATPDRNSLDFYSGFLLGIKDLDNDVTNIDLNVFDCAQSIPLSSEKMDESQMIFGPITTLQLEKVAMMKKSNTMLISPLDPRAEKLAATYSNFIQVPPGSDAQYNDIASWVHEDYTEGDNVITIYEKNNGKQNIVHFNEIIQRAGLNSKFFSYTILEGRTLESRLGNELTKTGTNRIIINSENEAFVNDVIRNLNILLHKKNQIVIYCSSKIRSFDTIDIENLHNLNTHMAGSYHTDYDDPVTGRFVKRYRALYNSEPSQFSFQGYDLATYFVGMYSRYGIRWTRHLETDKESLRQLTFDFKKNENGSFINQGTRRFIYEADYKIRMVK